MITRNEHIVLVLGAGASISEVKSYNSEVKENDQEQNPVPCPPSDATFLEAAQQHCPQEFQRITCLYSEVWNGAPPFRLERIRMEQLFSTSYARVQQTKGTTIDGKKARELYDTLVIALRETLVRTTKINEPKQHIKLLTVLRECEPASLTVTSFNYDLLADRALHIGHRRKHWRWDYRAAYGFRPRKAPAKLENPDLLLLKFHGSMNWYIDTPGKTRSVAFRPNQPVHIPKPSSKANSPFWERRQKERKSGKGKSVPIFPLLVPPIVEKSTHVTGIFRDIWKLAESSLAKATLVIFWGYSLPPTDYHAEILFAQAARSSRFKLIVINPSFSALAHVTEVVGHGWNRWFFDIDDFFQFASQDVLASL